MHITYETTIKSFDNHAAIQVAEKDVLSFGVGKRVPVKVTIHTYSYQSTITVMEGMYLIPLAMEHRLKAGIKGGDTVNVTLTLESKNRDVDIPLALKDALNKENLLDKFERLPYSTRKEYARQITDAKKEETFIKRMDKIIQALK